MSKTINKNIQLTNLIKELKTLAIKDNVKIWKAIASFLEKPTRRTRIVNLAKIEKNAKDGDVIIVPGKVLGSGNISKKVTVAAHSFSQSALDKLNKVGTTLTIKELIAKYPKGSSIRIMG